MNLYFRVIYLFIVSRFRPRTEIMAECSTPFRVWPTDLDILRHMNNGVYFSVQDLARTDYMLRIGVAGKLVQQGWYSVVTAERLRFKKSLKPFEKFTIKTQLVYWDEKHIYIQQKFMNGKNELAAWGNVRMRFLQKTGGLVSPQQVMTFLGVNQPTPPLPEYLKLWIATEEAHESALH